MGKIDSITISVLISRLQSIAEEMNAHLVRSAFSTNIKVRRDCSCAIYSPKGDMVAQGEFIPVHLGVMVEAMKGVFKEYPPDSFKPGDAIIHNDYCSGGSHLWDYMIFKPVFCKDRLIAFVGNTAHHLDVGGSSTRFNLPTVFEEGLRIPPVKIMEKGEIQDDILKIITANCRTSYEIRGDMMAQMSANYKGEEEIIELAKRYGSDKLLEYFEEILNYSERSMRRAIQDIPDGEASFEDYIEYDGIGKCLIKIKTRIKIEGNDIYLDFKGTGRPGRGGVNSPWALTKSSAYYAIKAVISPDIPTNEGAYRPIHLIKPDDESILNAQFPRAVGACTGSPSMRIVDVIIGALSKIVPEKTCAADGHWPELDIHGFDPGKNRLFAFYETYACGRGAKHDDDGADAHQTHMTNTRNAPIEIIEREYPIRVDRYILVTDSGGAGKFRGGLSIRREMTCLAPSTVSLILHRSEIGPYGLFGGYRGDTDSGGVLLEDESLAMFARDVKPGTKVFIQTSGGGGWGDPFDRDAEKVEWDVLNGYISLKLARDKYGVIIDPKTHIVKRKETEVFRAQNRSKYDRKG